MRIEAIILAAGVATFLVAGVAANQQKTAPSQAQKIFARAKADDFMGDSGCNDCHSKTVEAFHGSGHEAFMKNPKAPLEKQGCEGCHGAGSIHQADENPEVIAFRSMTPKESSAACLRCHESTLSERHWKLSSHSQADLSCVSCHQIHPDSEPNWVTRSGKAPPQNPKAVVHVARIQPKALLMADEMTLCGQCHASEVAKFRLPSHHPVPEGNMVCSDCHTVHPSKAAKGKVAHTKENCVTCHSQFEGPFAFEHDPVAGNGADGCMECHKPHGSGNPKMLKAFSRGLCAQCHTEKLGSHYPGRTCWSAGCHVASHGSNSSPHFLQP